MISQSIMCYLLFVLRINAKKKNLIRFYEKKICQHFTSLLQFSVVFPYSFRNIR